MTLTLRYAWHRVTIFLKHSKYQGYTESLILNQILLSGFTTICIFRAYIKLLFGLMLNWKFLGLNSWPDCVAISRNITRHGSNLNVWSTKKMLNFLILKYMFSLLNCIRGPPMINYTKPPINQNNNPSTVIVLLL